MNILGFRDTTLSDEEIASFEQAGIPETLAAHFSRPVRVVSVRIGFSEEGDEGMVVGFYAGSHGDIKHDELWIHDPDGENPYGLDHRQVSMLGLVGEAQRRIDRRECDDPANRLG